MFTTKAYSVASATAAFGPSAIPRRDPLDRDVQIDILFCGHSDSYFSRNEWKSVMPANYPCVPGHEIVGRVAKVGAGVRKFKSGDLVGVDVSPRGTIDKAQLHGASGARVCSTLIEAPKRVGMPISPSRTSNSCHTSTA